jgi:hypothetical protein
MPGGDRTGPRGLGPKTGRAAGYCAGYNAPGYTNFVYRRGLGRGGGRGLGRGFWGHSRGFGWRREYPYPEPYYPYPGAYQVPSEEEKAYLENMVKSLEEEMKILKQRLQDLSKEKKEE